MKVINLGGRPDQPGSRLIYDEHQTGMAKAAALRDSLPHQSLPGPSARALVAHSSPPQTFLPTFPPVPAPLALRSPHSNSENANLPPPLPS